MPGRNLRSRCRVDSIEVAGFFGRFCIFGERVNYYYRSIQTLRARLHGRDYQARRIIKAKNFIDSHFSNAIDLEKIASQAYLSKYHFVRQFKIIYGLTPHQYLLEVRMQKAKQFLKEGLSVLEVCMLTGFESIPSFTRIFKKITGTTPARFGRLSKSNFG